MFGGSSTGESPIWKSAKLVNSCLLFGISIDLGKHFFTNWRTGKFQAYDYGKKKNIEIYGSEQPFNYLDNFKSIDIPIHYFISMDDSLIRADNILRMYETLKEHHPELAKVKVFQGFSHIDFTYSCHNTMIGEIL